MKRARYRGRKSRGGLTEGQVCAAFLAILIAVLVMTMKVSSQWSGLSCTKQLYQAVFVTRDWE